MRIMQILSGKGVNGAVLQCLALTRALAARGHEVTLVCRPKSWLSEQPLGNGIRRVCSRLSRWTLSDLRHITEVAQDQRVQVIHTHQTRAHRFGVLLRWLTGRPCVATAHSRFVQMHWWFNDFVIANSAATFGYHRRWNRVPGDRMEVVNYLLDTDQFEGDSAVERAHYRAAWNVSDDCLLAGVIADAIPRKGHLYAVRAWARIRSALPDAKLIFIGHEKNRAYVRQVRAEAARLGVADRIVWAGYHQNIPSVMRSLDLCVSAAVEEALGLTIPEAMAARRAVVATNVGGVSENVWHEETGLLVPPADPAALGDAMFRLLSNNAWRQDCGERGWQRVSGKYNAQRQLEQVESIYERLGRRSPRRVERAAEIAQLAWCRLTKAAVPSDEAWISGPKLLGS